MLSPHTKTRKDAKKIFYFCRRFATVTLFMKSRIFAFLAIAVGSAFSFFVASCALPGKSARGTDPLIFISIDAFRWDYLQKADVPTLKNLAAAGVHVTRVIPSFPSKTFPNHYTLATGLYPENHGIVSNYFYDPALKKSFASPNPINNSENMWWGGEPIWITAERQGVRSACFFWVGSEAEIHGLRPSFHRPYKKALTSNERVDGLLTWLALPPEQRPKFATLYLDLVDTTGHKFGPDAPETYAALKEVDGALARLLAGLVKLDVRDTTNLVVVSDHGLTAIDAKRVIFLEDLMPIANLQVESYGPNGGVRPKVGTAEELVASIRAKQVPHLQVYLREETPERFHYRHNPRIPPVVLVADEGWNIETKLGWPNREPTYDRASHGYDPALPSMGALFIANGPAFKRGVEIPTVENIHVYNLLCAALDLKPAPNDGDLRLAKAALKR